MLEISDLGLTIFQMMEVDDTDPVAVDAWLAAAARPEIRNPTGYFLKGLRSGELPGDNRPERAHDILRAERWIENVGLLYDHEEPVIEELFGERGMLRHQAGDAQLQERLLALWRRHRPRGEQVEQEFLARAARNRKTLEAMR